jgi:RNA polymerase sigma-70 factor, ECF subfamily
MRISRTAASPQEVEPAAAPELSLEDQQDRMLRLLKAQDAENKKGREVGSPRVSADPREQILALYDEFRPRLFSYLSSMLLKRHHAEEVIQETFMRLTVELVEENEIVNVQGWIVRVAHNLAVDVLKKHGRDWDRMSEITSPEALNVTDPSPGPEEALLNKDQIRRMETALLRLTAQQRQAFHLRAEGFRYKDIADVLGVSEQRAAFVVKEAMIRLAAICG